MPVRLSFLSSATENTSLDTSYLQILISMCFVIPSSYFTTSKHANYLPYYAIFYEVYCVLVDILGKEYYSTVSL